MNCSCFDVREVYAYTKNGRLCTKMQNMTKLFEADFINCIQGMDRQQTNETKKTEMEFNCLSDYKQIFEDYLCTQHLRSQFYENRDVICDCKPPCYEMEYELTIGSSQWPAAGSQMNTAYSKLIQSETGIIKEWLNKTLSRNPYTINSNATACGVNSTSTQIARQISDYLESLTSEHSEKKILF